MVRNVYRCYLYVVYLALVVFAAVGLGRLLQVVFSQNPTLRGSYGTSASGQEVVQALVFVLVSWLIAGSLGGLHFWLIRRDMRTDPDAAKGGAVRAFFLNGVLFWLVGVTTMIAAFMLFPLLGRDSDVTYQLAFVLAALAVMVLLEWDRQRYPAQSTIAQVFQRLHFYGIQLLLLGFFITTWYTFVGTFLLFIGSNVLHLTISDPNCYGGCTTPAGADVWRAFGSVAWVTIFWLGYGWIMRKDIANLLRHLAHFLSLAVGFGFCIGALKLVIDLLLLAVIGQPVALAQVLEPGGTHNFVGPLTAALLVLAVYGHWMNYVVRGGAIQRSVVLSISETLLTIALAVAFWWGVGLLLYNAMELWFASARIDATTWTAAWALLLAGIAYLPLDYHLYRRTRQADLSGPRRGLLFALIGSGTVALAIGASVALYAVGTSALGSPLTNWPQVTRMGLAAFLVGAAVAGFYLWRFRREFPADTTKTPTKGTPGPAAPLAQPTEGSPVTLAPTQPLPGKTLEPATPDAVLDALQAGKITRVEALSQLQQLFLSGARVSDSLASQGRPQHSSAEVIEPEIPEGASK